MLGRQQIANVSTAISELFKNGHDAYADQAEVDYFRSDDLLVIRDNGVGMTPEEFEERWLVLGTESKYARDGQKAEAYKPKDKPERAITGEKGIGRLAIALLGRQVLVLTRAERHGKLHDLLMCFIHWELFEISGINLDEIEIPIMLISGGRLPSAGEVNSLLKKMSTSVSTLAEKHGSDYFSRILRDIDDIQLDPEDIDEFLGGSSLKDGGCGTHFFVVPADEGIAYEIERERQEDSKEFTKFLLGFCNSVFRENPPPPIETAFRYWPTEAFGDDLIGQGEFFTSEELTSADHRISGRFDKYGQFKGNVRIYEEEIDNHIIPWRDGGGRPTRCGPFEVEFGCVAGAQRESRLPPDEWKRITDKLNTIGGLYVYRDRIRILPYGNSDLDWLDIEQRRTKGMAYYFFSYRRVFGAVTLTREHNEQLKEKAGREGFQQDMAYRQLKGILENLFLQLAADFFRDSGDYSEYYSKRRQQLEKLERARRKREKQVTTKRRQLAAALDSIFDRIGNKLPETELISLQNTIEQRMDCRRKNKRPRRCVLLRLLDAEKEATIRLGKIRESYRVAKPRGVGLSQALQRSWNDYLVELEKLEEEIFEPFSQKIAHTLGAVAKEAKLYVDQRRRLADLITHQAESEKKLITREAGQLRHSVDDTRSAALTFARDAIRELQETITQVEVDFAQKDLVGLSEQDIEHVRNLYETRIESVGRKNTDTLGTIRDMLTAVSSNIRQGLDISESDIVEAMDQELQELRDQADADAELVQLGLAVAIINHEFEAAIRGVRRALRELRPWTSSNIELSSLYQEIRNNFDHLDGHLNLFTPLQRRLYRKAIVIQGSDIAHYVRTLFEVRMKRHQVNIWVTDAFLNSNVTAFPFYSISCFCKYYR